MKKEKNREMKHLIVFKETHKKFKVRAAKEGKEIRALAEELVSSK